MRTIGKFTQLGHNFTVKVNILNTNSNHNAFAHVFHEGEKQPLCGTSFTDGTSKDDIILWAKKRIGEIQAEQLVYDISEDVKGKPKTAEEEYPELDNIAFIIANKTTALINELSKAVNSENPYKAQCILEMVIAKLKKDV